MEHEVIHSESADSIYYSITFSTILVSTKNKYVEQYKIDSVNRVGIRDDFGKNHREKPHEKIH